MARKLRNLKNLIRLNLDKRDKEEYFSSLDLSYQPNDNQMDLLNIHW